MPDVTQSERLRELRSVFPSNTREIQTIQISQPDVLVPKTLQVCFVIDTWYSSSTYQEMVQRVIDQLGQIRSELETTYEAVRWALVAIEGQEWSLLTGSNFVGYTTFATRLAETILANNATSGQIYAPVIDAAETLNWLPDSDYVEKHMVYIGDTPNLTTTVEAIPFNHTGQAEAFNNYGGYSRILPLDGALGTIDIAALGWNQVGINITVSGFVNPENNGTFLVVSPANSRSWFLSNAGDLVFVVDEIDATVVIDGTYISTTTSADTPTLAIFALQEKGIVFNQTPTFVNAHLTLMLTETGGMTLSYAQLATAELVQENVVLMLSNTEYFSSDLETIYLTNDNRNLTALLETSEEVTFLRRSFAIDPFSSGEEGSISIPIKIDNSDLAISQYIAGAKVSMLPVEVLIRIYEEGDTSGPQNNPPLKLYATDFESKGSVVSCQLSWIDLHNAVFPNEFYTPTKCPSLQ